MSAVTPLPQAHQARSTIAACVRAHLGVRQISDSELARMIGTTQSQISRRTNERVPFDVDELGKIADALDMTVVELIQMPTPQMIGGGTTLAGVTPIRRGWNLTALANSQLSDYEATDPGTVTRVDFTRGKASS